MKDDFRGILAAPGAASLIFGDDRKFLLAAEEAAALSDYPTLRVGAVLVSRPEPGVKPVVLLHACNRFAGGVSLTQDELENREVRLGCTVHAELDLVLKAMKCGMGRRLEGGTVYTWPLPPCANCATLLCEVGIGRLVAPSLPAHLNRWKDSVELGKKVFLRKGVQYDLVIQEDK